MRSIVAWELQPGMVIKHGDMLATVLQVSKNPDTAKVFCTVQIGSSKQTFVKGASEHIIEKEPL